MSEIANVATLKAFPGKSEMLGDALTQLLAPTRLEEGCRAYELHCSSRDHDVWMVYERWTSEVAAAAHLKQPHVQMFLRQLPELVCCPIDVQSYTSVSSSTSPMGGVRADNPQ
jgi:quinol monooxygenase YgiN